MLNFDKDFKDFEPATSYIAAMIRNSQNLENLGIDPDASDDTVFGATFVYCGSHRNAHSTGWCSVPVASKRPLNAETIEAALTELVTLGFH